MADFTNINNVYVKDSDLWDGIDYIKDKIGYDDIIGVEVDYENNTFRRLASAVGKTAGADFNLYPMYSGMKRCNLADDGTVNAYYGDAGYVEDGSNGQVMVEIPKFYYRVIPLKLQKNTDYTGAMGNHLLKARYYISSTPKNGFKVHPLFHIGNRVINKAYISAYEGCIYDVSAGAYLQEDEQVADFTADKMSSIAGVKPCSGLTQNLIRPNARILCHNRGTGWEMQTIQAVCAINLLFMIEYGNCNWQAMLSAGISTIPDMANTNCASYTGSTASLGNTSGRAESTIDYMGTTRIAVDKTANSYRGIENYFGNIWKWVDGVNVWGNGAMGGGQLFICTDNNFVDNTITDNYKSADLTLANATYQWVKYFGYGNDKFDWLFFASKLVTYSPNSPIGSAAVIPVDANGHKMCAFGGGHNDIGRCGVYFATTYTSSSRGRTVGSRLAYFPTA